MFDEGLDAGRDGSALVFGQRALKARERLKLRGLLRGHARATRLGLNSGVRPEGQEDVARKLPFVLRAMKRAVEGVTELVASAGSDVVAHGHDAAVRVHIDLVVFIPIPLDFHEGKVVDALGLGAHEGLADVAEARGFGETLPALALQGDDDEVHDGLHRLVQVLGYWGLLGHGGGKSERGFLGHAL